VIKKRKFSEKWLILAEVLQNFHTERGGAADGIGTSRTLTEAVVMGQEKGRHVL
jgi:hypothetical protein